MFARSLPAPSRRSVSSWYRGHQGCTAVQMSAGDVVVRHRGALGQRGAVLPGSSKGTQPCCRRVVRSLAIAPAADIVHRVWPMIRERSIGEDPGYRVVFAVSGCVMNPVLVMPESPIRSTSAPDCAASGA